jgi:hypothetical protein
MYNNVELSKIQNPKKTDLNKTKIYQLRYQYQFVAKEYLVSINLASKSRGTNHLLIQQDFSSSLFYFALRRDFMDYLHSDTHAYIIHTYIKRKQQGITIFIIFMAVTTGRQTRVESQPASL